MKKRSNHLLNTLSVGTRDIFLEAVETDSSAADENFVSDRQAVTAQQPSTAPPCIIAQPTDQDQPPCFERQAADSTAKQNYVEFQLHAAAAVAAAVARQAQPPPTAADVAHSCSAGIFTQHRHSSRPSTRTVAHDLARREPAGNATSLYSHCVSTIVASTCLITRR